MGSRPVSPTEVLAVALPRTVSRAGGQHLTAAARQVAQLSIVTGAVAVMDALASQSTLGSQFGSHEPVP